MNTQNDLDLITENNYMTVGLYPNFINVLTQIVHDCLFVLYQTLTQYSLYRPIVLSNKIHFPFFL